MYTASIIKFEYRLFENAEFSELIFTSYTGTINKVTPYFPAGKQHVTVVNLKVPGVTSEKTILLDGLLHRKAQYRVTDSTNRVHTIGDAAYPARLEYEMNIEAPAGGWNGYTVKVNHVAPYSYPVS